MTLDTAWGDMICKQLITIQLDSSILRFFLFSQLPRIGQNVPYFGVSVGCLEGVWEVSGGCLAHSGLCLGPIDAKSIAISPVEMIN